MHSAVENGTAKATGTRLNGTAVAAVLIVLAVLPAFSQESENAAQTSQFPKPPPPQGGSIPRQEQNEASGNVVPQERWNLFWQATSIGQYHGTFSSPYADPTYSLQNYPEQVVSLTTTLFF